MNIDDYIGKKFGKWTILGEFERNKYGRFVCNVKCDCGRINKTILKDVINGRSTKCKSCASRLRPYESRFTLLKHSAKRKNQSVSLSYDDFLDFTNIKTCHYCDDIVIWNKYLIKLNGKTNNCYNLDRMDNFKGYTKDNCVVCCSRCNRIKNSDYTYDEMLKIGPFIRKIIMEREHQT